MTKKVTLLLSLSLLILGLNAQEQAPELVTDRPDMTESASVVPLYSLQIEAGSMWEYQKNTITTEENFTVAAVLLRFGISENTEIRLGSSYSNIDSEFNPGIISLRPATDSKGFSPIMFGIKTELFKESAYMPQVALLSHLALNKLASADFEATGISPEMIIAAEKGFSEMISAGINFGAAWSAKKALPELFFSSVIGISLGEKLGVFGEYYMYFGNGYQNRPMLDAGLTYLIMSNLQLDASGGYYLFDETGYFGSFGISYRIPK